jgi:hypothetical protein
MSDSIYQNLCGPAKLYTIVAFFTLIYLILKQNTNYVWFAIKSLIFIIWVFLLNIMCKNGYTAVAWVLAIIPQCIFIFCVERPKVKA